MSGDYVLVVDDDEDIRDCICIALSTAGYRCAAAGNGSEALAVLRGAPPPCLVLLDLMMPIMNGWDFRARMDQDPGLQAVPVVIMTGFREMAEKAKSMRVEAVLEKPVDLDRLLATIGRYCSVRTGSAT